VGWAEPCAALAVLYERSDAAEAEEETPPPLLPNHWSAPLPGRAALSEATAAAAATPDDDDAGIAACRTPFVEEPFTQLPELAAEEEEEETPCWAGGGDGGGGGSPFSSARTRDATASARDVDARSPGGSRRSRAADGDEWEPLEAAAASLAGKESLAACSWRHHRNNARRACAKP
jgi:hypothetical protein